MSDLEAQTLSQPLSTGPSLTPMQRVVDTFTAPSKTFEDIKRGNKSWWLPWVIMALIGYMFFAAVYTKVGMQTVVDNQMKLASEKQQEAMDKAPPEQRAMTAKVSLYVTEGVFAAGPIFVLVVAAIVSLVLWGTINFVFGGKASFGAIFAVWFFANLPSVIKALLGVVVVYASNTPETFNIKNYSPTNVAAFLPVMETNKAIYAFASSMDLITIWSLILMGMGVAIVAGVKRSSGYIAVFGWWAIIVLIGTGWAAAFG